MADDKEEVTDNPDPHFEPLVSLPAVETKTLEEDEQEILKLRAKLFRYDSVNDPPEWKERGVGDVKILKHRKSLTCRILMRRDKTLKVCANHSILSHMELKPNCDSEKAWVWSTPADFADEEAKSELLAIRFANAENAQKFKKAFEEGKKTAGSIEESNKTDDKKAKTSTENDAESKKDTDDVADKLKEMTVKETKDGDSKASGDKTSTTDSSEKDQAER